MGPDPWVPKACRTMTSRSGSIPAATSAVFVPIVWVTHFLVVYASESRLCRARMGMPIRELIAVTILALLALVGHAIWQRSSPGDGGTPQS